MTTDAGEKSGRHVAELFEQMRAAFGIMFVRTTINQPVPLQIIAFRNNKELRQYSPIYKGKTVELGGFFQTTDDEDFILVDVSQQDNWGTVFHEYAHLLLNGNFPPAAPWFDEGFAEYLSTMKVNNGTVTVGDLIPGAELLNEASKFRLLDLFRVTQFSDTYYKSGERRDMFYVESWLVAHYLFDTNRLAQTAKYFVLTNRQKMAIPEAVQAAYGVSIGEMEKTIWSNWQEGKLYAERIKSKIQTNFTATVQPLDPLEARARLADFQVHSLDYGDRGIEEFQQILRANPNLASAQRGLGYAYLRRRDLPQAAEHFRAAAKLGSSDPRVYFYTAVLRQQTEPTSMGSEEFIKDLRRAVELNPQYADAYHLLGLGLMRDGNFKEAEQNIRHAMELSPRNDMYRLNLAVVLVNQQKIGEGKAMLTGLAQSTQPMVAQQATHMLATLSKFESEPVPQVEAESEPAVAEASSPVSSSKVEDTEVVEVQKTDKRPMLFLKGKIIAVDCSTSPAAVLTIASAGRTYRLHVADRNSVVLINSGKFSCDWKNVSADLNYRDSGNLEGDVISLELP